MFVVSHDVDGAPFVEHRQFPESFDDVTEASITQTVPFERESCFERGHDCLRDGLAGQCRKLSGKLISLCVLDAQYDGYEDIPISI